MAQWLGLHDFTAEGLGELSGTTEKKKKNPGSFLNEAFQKCLPKDGPTRIIGRLTETVRRLIEMVFSGK